MAERPARPGTGTRNLVDSRVFEAVPVTRMGSPASNAGVDLLRIRLLVVAAIRLYREGLAEVLDRRDGFSVVGTAANRQEAVARSRDVGPQVVLLDMTTSESHVTVRDIARSAPEVRVVALGVAEVEGDVLACAEAGVAGYVPREASLEDLIAAIKGASRGEIPCSPRLLGSLWRRLATLAANQQFAPPTTVLTRREREIVRLIDADLTNKEIARNLGIEIATVKNHIHNLLEKLGVHRRTEAARLLGGSPYNPHDLGGQIAVGIDLHRDQT